MSETAEKTSLARDIIGRGPRHGVNRPERETDGRMSASAAGYMELEGAKKDGDCRKVNVKGGVSKELGCCNEFEPESEKAEAFRCGLCEYLK